eukprot:1394394-Amorphochlora_amoeboformis.AAC.1
MGILCVGESSRSIVMCLEVYPYILGNSFSSVSIERPALELDLDSYKVLPVWYALDPAVVGVALRFASRLGVALRFASRLAEARVILVSLSLWSVEASVKTFRWIKG